MPALGAVASPTGDAVAYTAADVGGTARCSSSTSRPAAPAASSTPAMAAEGWFAWRPDGRRFATAGDDGFVRVWDWRTGELITERHVAPMHITGLDYTGDGRRLVVGERPAPPTPSTPRRWNPTARPIQLDQPMGNVVRQPGQPHRHRPHPGSLLTRRPRQRPRHPRRRGPRRRSPASSRLTAADSRSAAASVTSACSTSRPASGPGRRGVGHDGEILTVDYAPDGATFVTGADDGAIVLWDADTGAPLNRVLPGRPADGR